MSLAVLWHVCTPEQHAEGCAELQLTAERPSLRSGRMVIEFHPSERLVAELGEGPVFLVARDTAEKWPYTISYR